MGPLEQRPEKSPALIRIKNWPPYFMGGEVPDLRVGNPDAHVGVVTLWTPVDQIWSGLNPDKVAVAGQLKTPGAGLSGIIRTCAANRAIRQLVICGKEMKEGKGSQVLKSLLQNDVDGQRRVIGSPEGAKISETIPFGQIEFFREQISLVDLRGVVDGTAIQQAIDGLDYQEPFAKAEAVLLPLPEIKTQKFPRRVGTEVVAAQTIGEAYIPVLDKVLRFGPASVTNYGQTAEDVLNIITITDEEMGDPTSWHILPFTRQQMERYVEDNFLNPRCPSGEWYTYGERIFAFGPEEINQFEIVVSKLLKDPNDRGAMAVLWDPAKDNRALRNPCLYSFQASIEGNRLFLTGVFRSNDMANGWPWNAFGLRRLQRMVLERVKPEYSDLKMGSLITISTRAHIYQSARETAVGLVEEHQGRGRESWDQRGNFLIGLENEEIVARLSAPDSGEILQEFRGRTAHQLARRIYLADAVGQISHALDLGIHLAQAEVALKLSWPYLQEERYLERMMKERLAKRT